MPDANIADIKTCVLNLLARREHSKRELLQKLLLRSYDMSSITAVLDNMEANNYQSDARFTESYVRSRIAKGYGPLKIRAELYERGVCVAIVERYLSYDSEFWFNQICQVWQKKFGGMVANSRQALSKQCYFLRSRGFAHDEITRLCRKTNEK